MIRTTALSFCLLGAALLGACAGEGNAAQPFTIEAQLWPDADQLFRGDPHWLGSGAGHSVDLGGGRTLWLFKNSFVDPDGTGDRANAVLVQNTVAVQTGADPRTATIDYFWSRGAGAGVDAFFPGDGDDWFWPMQGLVHEGELTIFLLRVRATGEPGPFGFTTVGWEAVRIPNPQDDPDDWTITFLQRPAMPFDVVIGSSPFVQDGFVHAFAILEPGDHHVYLARWPEAGFAAGDLSGLEWHDGDRFVPNAQLRGAPRALSRENAPEMSISFVEQVGLHVQVFSRGLGDTPIAVRSAPAPDGPWSGKTSVFIPPESLRGDRIVLGAKAHPQLLGADLVVTYGQNAEDLADVIADDTLFYPRFVRFTFVDPR